ncbi:hypothetical protein [Streptomyces xiamenensis]|uniref:hypothetical protein n=1 Tax=Streptomyces xiamenensis TaxID=408015 RepID=UPI0035E38488
MTDQAEHPAPAQRGLFYARWAFAPLTTWRARRILARRPSLDPDMAWTLARLERHPEEIGIAARRHGREQLTVAWEEHRRADGGEGDSCYPS